MSEFDTPTPPQGEMINFGKKPHEFDPETISEYLYSEAERFADPSGFAQVPCFIPDLHYSDRMAEDRKQGRFDVIVRIGRPGVRVDGGITLAEEGYQINAGFSGSRTGHYTDYSVELHRNKPAVLTSKSWYKGNLLDQESVAADDIRNPSHPAAIRRMQFLASQLQHGIVFDPKAEVIDHDAQRILKRRSIANIGRLARRRAQRAMDDFDRVAGIEH